MSPLQVFAVTTLFQLCKQKMARRAGGREITISRGKIERRGRGEKSVSEKDGGKRRKTGRELSSWSLTHSYCSGYSTELRGM